MTSSVDTPIDVAGFELRWGAVSPGDLALPNVHVHEVCRDIVEECEQVSSQGNREAKQLFLDTFGILPDRDISVSMGHFFEEVHGFHPDNRAAGQALWQAVVAVYQFDLESIGFDHNLKWDVQRNTVLIGGPCSTLRTAIAFEYAGEELRLRRPGEPGDPRREPIIPWPYSNVADRQRVEQIVALYYPKSNDRLQLNWPIRGVESSYAKPRFHGIKYPKRSDTGCYIDNVYYPFVSSDLLIVTRMPNVLHPGFADLATSHDRSDWPYLLVFAGCHGVATRAVQLLTKVEAIDVLKEVSKQIRNAETFQVLFEVGDIKVTPENLHFGRSIRVLDCQPLAIEADRFLALHEHVKLTLDRKDRIQQSEQVDYFRIPTVGSVGQGQQVPLVPVPAKEPTMPNITYLLNHDPPHDAEIVVGAIKELHTSARQALQPTIDLFQEVLHRLAGQQFGNFENNRSVASAIDELLILSGQRVACPKEDCGEPAVIGYRAAGTAKDGVFEARHSKKGRPTTHGVSTTLPRYTLVDAPADPRRKR